MLAGLVLRVLRHEERGKKRRLKTAGASLAPGWSGRRLWSGIWVELSRGSCTLFGLITLVTVVDVGRMRWPAVGVFDKSALLVPGCSFFPATCRRCWRFRGPSRKANGQDRQCNDGLWAVAGWPSSDASQVEGTGMGFSACKMLQTDD